MKKSLIFGLIAFCLMLQLVSAINIDVTTKVISDTVISEANEPAVFNFTIHNLGASDDFEIYSLVGADVSPRGLFHLNGGETKEIEFKFYLDDNLRKNFGILNFAYKIRGVNSGIKDYFLTVNVVGFDDALEIGAANFAPDSGSALVYVQNKVNAGFSNIKTNFKSTFFEKSEEYSLNPLEKKEFTVTLDKSKLKGIVAGTYILTGEFQIGSFKQNLEGNLRYVERSDIVSSDKSSGIIFRGRNIERINNGNIPVLAEIKARKDIISRLFSRFSPEPSKVQRKWFVVDYIWVKELKPGEALSVKISTNYLYPLLLLLAIILIAYFVYKLVSSDLVVKKRVGFVRTKGGEFALKVTLNVSARKFVEKISIVDRFPGIVKLYERFGTFHPDKVDELNRRLEWNIESLHPGEERVFSYIIYSKVGVIGRFELPSTLAVYEKDGKIKETNSNKAFFMNEPRARED